MAYKYTFYATLGFLFLLPIFFIPGGMLAVSDAKSTLLILGLSIILLLFFYEIFVEKEINFPKHYLFYASLALPVVYLLSALLATPSSLSLLGYNFEVGTFGYILLGSIFVVVSSTLFFSSGHTSAKKVIQAGMALLASLSLLAVFSALKIAIHAYGWTDFLILGNFVDNMSNPLGSWTDMAVVFGLLSVLLSLVIGMLPMKLSMKVLSYALLVLATTLLVVINFRPAFWLTLGGSIFLFFYFFTLEKEFYLETKTKRRVKKGSIKNFFSQPVFLPSVIGLVSLIFILNPVIGGNTLGSLVSGSFGVSNSEVHPTLSATLSVSKAVLSEDSLFGSGPNTFASDWLIHRPVGINATPFWGLAFPFGVGFIPTQISSTGILGTLVWLIFFCSLLTLAIRTFSNMPDTRPERFVRVFTLIGALFLWAGSFLYAPSAATLMLSFGFVGILLALSMSSGVIPTDTVPWGSSPRKQLFSLALAVLFLLGLHLGFIGVEKTLAAFHFKRAVDLSNVENMDFATVEYNLRKAVGFSGTDRHYIALSQLNLAKAEKASGEEGQAEEFQASLGRGIEAARAAATANPAGYNNWVHLGNIYSGLVPEPLKVDGAYEYARLAYSEAFKRNPSNPELPLLLAQLEINKGDVETARLYIRNSLSLKGDHAPAYLLLARLEISQNNIEGAVASAEKLSSLDPTNATIHFEIGSLKYSAGDYEGAKASFSKALELSPDYANAKYYLALSLRKLGQTGLAESYLRELLTDDPDNEELKKALDDLSAEKEE